MIKNKNSLGEGNMMTSIFIPQINLHRVICLRVKLKMVSNLVEFNVRNVCISGSK